MRERERVQTFWTVDILSRVSTYASVSPSIFPCFTVVVTAKPPVMHWRMKRAQMIFLPIFKLGALNELR